ncbi:MAG: response regulator [Rhodothermaceae bacterium]
MTTKIIVADDHPIIHQGVSRLEELDTSIKIIGNAMNGRELVSMCRRMKADVIIVDDSMPVMDGVTATSTILRKRKKSKIIFYTFSNNKNQIYERYKMGIKGYVLKSSPLEDLLEAIRTVREGNLYFNQEFPESSFDYYQSRKRQTDFKLTYRERQVLKLIAQGFQNAEIAGSLDLSVRTIEEHRRRIRRKYDLNGANELIKFAIESTSEL